MYNEKEKGKDILNISLYDFNNKLISSSIIKDDGEDDKLTNKNNTDEQTGELNVNGLKEGVYKLELKNNDDMLITKIKLNQNKIVLKGSIFLAQSGAYFNNFEKKSQIYFKTQKKINLVFRTWHDYGLQTIFIDSQEFQNPRKLEIKNKTEEYSLEIPPSEEFYKIISEKNDIKITGPEFFSFTKDSWFNPFEGKNIQYKNDLKYLEQNADYVLVDYILPKTEGEWKIASISLDIKKDNLYIKDNKLNMMLNAPHLNQNKTKFNYIPIDWINITINKEGYFEQ
ncbi:MAG: hypothetical protein QT05_C0037G0007 [archaeon GW2011_AR13]|nr:MAG: hypothetical protein QT05_C0037G0007 [archaeon GW2011_AR13]HIG94944.1 hypothetical protein [Nanoarchaeota archaeon]HIH62785.1 hypothetical protein [Nanoarchaeota archaeon]HIJ10191.1 hypothetical protein [Nanoarchaeota archaeon]